MTIYEKPDLEEKDVFWIIFAWLVAILPAFLFCIAHASGPKNLVINNQLCGKVSTLQIDANKVSIRTVGDLKCGGSPPPEPPPPGVKVVDPGKGMTILPNCVNGIHWRTSNCDFTGHMKGGEVIAIRVDNRDGSTGSFQYAEVSSSETSDERVKYTMSVSVKPGDFNVSPQCKSTSRVTTLYEGHSRPNACPVPLSVLYVNLKAPEECNQKRPCRPKVKGTFIY